MIEKELREAAQGTPDPERAFKNLSAFLSENPQKQDELQGHLRPVATLFAYSQFLANYCISNPAIMFDALRSMDGAPDRELLSSSLRTHMEAWSDTVVRPSATALSLFPEMNAAREFKKREVLRITFRDILNKTDLVEAMLELSMLADVLLAHALGVVRASLDETYGAPRDDAFAVISLGKLGGEELNFSSDVDLIFVYGTEDGETTGIRTAQGVTVNRISNHEYYCKVGETLTRFLAENTESGYAYRVDLRLRPEGQRGAIALGIRGYETYYESWGRAWERAALIRARPVAGDTALGSRFMQMIRPFVYRKYLDFSAIDEIRKLKTRIDSTFKKGDIKRGYGGIREVEFFAQALQLIYGGREPLLRERNVLKVLHLLLQKALIGQQDFSALSENYRYLRTLEHRLQQLNDLQTHTLPMGGQELECLGRKMGAKGRQTFLADLERRRRLVRSIYDSLLTEKKELSPAGTLFSEEISDAELREYLVGAGLTDAEKAVRNIRSIRDSTYVFQTLRGRRLLGEILPVFVDSALKTGDPDAALQNLQSFTHLLSANESYLDIFSRDRGLIDMLTYSFSQSEYLSKMLMSRPSHLEMIGWQDILSRKSLRALRQEIEADVSEGQSVNDAVRFVRRTEEIRLGLLFLKKRIGVAEVVKGLSKTAQAVLSACMEHVSGDDSRLAVIGLGKLGAREMTFNSDLDIIFVAAGDAVDSDTRTAEKMLRMLVSYTKEGIAYRVDTRLRPDGSKGPLVRSLEGFAEYYNGAAAFWELQALLKARPVAGSAAAGVAFLKTAREALMARGNDVPASEIRKMRDRIVRELSREQEGYDIKLGPGGIEDLEFVVQYLQLAHCRRHPQLLVQDTVTALRRLSHAGVLRREEREGLETAYLSLRTIESFLRLRGENVLKKEDKKLRGAAEFMGLSGGGMLREQLDKIRANVGETSERYLRDAP